MMRWFLPLALTACSFSLRNPFDDDDAPSVVSVAPGAKGDLGKVEFTYVCISPHEQTCLAFNTTSVAFPAGIAVGAAFYVKDASLHTIDAASPALVPGLGAYRASRAGRIGLMAIDASRVVDFIHPRFVAATSLDAQIDPVTPVKLRMKVGETQVLSALPKADNTPLGGTIDAEWTTDAPAVLGFDTASPAHFMTLHATAVGTAKLTMKWNGLARDFSFTVEAL